MRVRNWGAARSVDRSRCSLAIQPRVAQAHAWFGPGSRGKDDASSSRPPPGWTGCLTHPRQTTQGPGRRLCAEKGGHAARKRPASRAVHLAVDTKRVWPVIGRSQAHGRPGRVGQSNPTSRIQRGAANANLEVRRHEALACLSRLLGYKRAQECANGEGDLLQCSSHSSISWNSHNTAAEHYIYCIRFQYTLLIYLSTPCFALRGASGLQERACHPAFDPLPRLSHVFSPAFAALGTRERPRTRRNRMRARSRLPSRREFRVPIRYMLLTDSGSLRCASPPGSRCSC